MKQNLRSKRTASSVRGGSDRNFVRWNLQFLLAANDGCRLRPIREKAAADYFYGSGAVIYASYNGAMVVTLTEIMPVEVRTSGFSLAYSLATALLGGFTPAICTYLIHITGNRAAPGLWMSFAALLGLIAAFLIPRPENDFAGVGLTRQKA
jgi:hypothetical protein